MKHNFENLKIWQVAVDIADATYEVMDELPDKERFNLVSQSIRSACSISANIAEGSAKQSDRDFKRYLEIALGSSYELYTHLVICQRRRYGDRAAIDTLQQLLNEEQKMIIGMIKTLKTRIASDTAKKASVMIGLLSASIYLLH